MHEEEENPVGQERPWTSVEEWLAWIAEAGGDPIFPDGREQPEMQERDWDRFDD